MTHRDGSDQKLKISAFDGAHNSMPKYSDQYESVKNAAEVENLLKQGGARPEQSSLHWQFGLRNYQEGKLVSVASNSSLHKQSKDSKLTATQKQAKDIRFRTNFATKPD